MADCFTLFINDLRFGQAPSQGLIHEDVVNFLSNGITNQPASCFEMTACGALNCCEKRPDLSTSDPQSTSMLNRQWLFLERAINPLQLAQAQATKHLRYRIRQLLSAIVGLEELGYTYGDLAVQNIGIDASSCLKVFDFGAAMSKTDDTFNHGLEKDRTGFDLSILHPLRSRPDGEREELERSPMH